MRRILVLILILAAALSACQSGPAYYVRSKWQQVAHPCPEADYFGLVWSPDSTHLAYATTPYDGTANAFSVDLRTRSTTLLGNTVMGLGPMGWSVKDQILL